MIKEEYSISKRMSEDIARATIFLQKADYKISRRNVRFFSFLFDVEDVCDLYIRAANLFKKEKEWEQSGDAFLKASYLYLESENTKYLCASMYIEASKCFEKVLPQKAVKCLTSAIDIFTDLGKFIMSAKYHVKVAQIYVSINSSSNVQKIIKNYQKAADYYYSEGSDQSCNRCLLQVAEHSILSLLDEGLCKAIKVYEKLGTECSQDIVFKYFSKEYFFKALLCHLCLDDDISEIITKYGKSFKNTDECKFFDNLDDISFTKFAHYNIRVDQLINVLICRLKNTEDDLR
uniref:Alpha-soluble NSF attachment protein n=1 Tax=viral metagenome TaxID=1070528 RepID=A0A6C0JSU0_9ZZZZ